MEAAEVPHTNFWMSNEKKKSVKSGFRGDFPPRIKEFIGPHPLGVTVYGCIQSAKYRPNPKNASLYLL